MIYKIIDTAIIKNASDIHLTLGIKPKLRIDGSLCSVDKFDILNNETLNQIKNNLINENQLKQFKRDKFIDFSISYKNKRLRIHIFKQKGENAFSIRLIPIRIPEIEELNLPHILKAFTKLRKGLILVTGAVGSGKTTTLAAMINDINNNQNSHIITLEDPIEYIHQHKNSIVTQKEIGVDINNFKDAVFSSMREDPDVLSLGELRDLETVTSAITMAETGHLVFGTLHTKSAAETVDRIIDVFPPQQQRQIRNQFANSIKGIVSQELIPMINGGRIPCCEVMVINDAIRNLIREESSLSSINDQIHMNTKKLGSQTRFQSLNRLILENKISIDQALKGLSKSEINNFNRILNQN